MKFSIFVIYTIIILLVFLSEELHKIYLDLPMCWNICTEIIRTYFCKVCSYNYNNLDNNEYTMLTLKTNIIYNKLCNLICAIFFVLKEN